MRKVLSTLALMLMLMSCAGNAQETFTVSVATVDGATQIVMAKIGQEQSTMQTLEVAGNRATATGKIEKDAIYCLIDNINRMQSFFVADAKTITVDMNTDVVTGSEQNQTLTGLMQKLSQVETSEEAADMVVPVIKANKDNCIGAFALSLIYYALDYNTLSSLLAEDAPFLHHPATAQVQDYYNGLKKRAPCSMFTDLTENDPDGNAHKLSEYVGRGNYVLVDFWASWCGPCMMEMPNVKACYEKYKSKGFNVVGLSFDRNADDWKTCIAENGLDWTHLSDLKYWQTVAAQTYGIQSIPSSILCDPTGKIIAVDLRGPQLGSKLAEIYGF